GQDSPPPRGRGEPAAAGGCDTGVTFSGESVRRLHLVCQTRELPRTERSEHVVNHVDSSRNNLPAGLKKLARGPFGSAHRSRKGRGGTAQRGCSSRSARKVVPRES